MINWIVAFVFVIFLWSSYILPSTLSVAFAKFYYILFVYNSCLLFLSIPGSYPGHVRNGWANYAGMLPIWNISLAFQCLDGNRDIWQNHKELCYILYKPEKFNWDYSHVYHACNNKYSIILHNYTLQMVKIDFSAL